MSENDIKPVAWVDLECWKATNDAGESFFTDYQDEETVALYDQSAIDRLTAERDDLNALLMALQARHREVMAERDDALAAVSSKAGWEWKKRAEQAEAERDMLRFEKYRLQEIRQNLEAERDAAVADVERLNWLEQFVRKAWMYGASFDFVKAFDGEGGGYRFMTHHRLDARQPTLRKSIDAARSEGE